MCIYKSNLPVPPDLGETEYCACSSLRRAARAVTQLFDAWLKPLGIRSTQFVLLVTVAKLEPVSLGRLARVLVIDRTTLTRSLSLMKRQGFVGIAPRSTMRQRFVTLLPKGRGVLDQSLPFWKKAQDHFVEKVGEQCWSAMQKELEKLPSVAMDLQRAAKGASQQPRGLGIKLN